MVIMVVVMVIMVIPILQESTCVAAFAIVTIKQTFQEVHFEYSPLYKYRSWFS
jgi:hypothetical protein